MERSLNWDHFLNTKEAFAKMLFTEPMKPTKEIFISCFLCLLQMNLSLIDFFDRAMK